jgi:CDGSH-type Zn-finger protein
MSEPAELPYITVQPNGPYIVHGPLPLEYAIVAAVDDDAPTTWLAGEPVPTTAKYALCRCGHSSNKPFCDGTHRKVGFDGTETASRAPFEQQAVVYDGPSMQLGDAGALCAGAGFCDAFGGVRAVLAATNDSSGRERLAAIATHCPSGRLVAYDKESLGAAVEAEFEPVIGVVEDPGAGCSGGYWVRGAVEVRSADGTPYAVRPRQLLCRCGTSSNKPFCDGSHAAQQFADDQLAAASEVTGGRDLVEVPEV